MSNRPLLAPSILSADFSRLGDEIAEVENYGANWLHIDVMDGHFVPNISMGPLVVEACKRVSNLPLDVHLMIENPERHLESFALAGADHISIHVEASASIGEALESIHRLGCKAGAAVNPGTPAEAIEEVLNQADILLVMSVNPGFGGQRFMPEVLSKVQWLRSNLAERHADALIEIDGGIDADTLPEAFGAGVDVFVAGSSVFRHPGGIGAGMQALHGAVPETQMR